MSSNSYRPLIAVSPTHLPEKEDIRLATNYTDSIIAAGGTPVILPMTTDETVIEQIMSCVDGLLLTGGNDIEPELYGVSPTLADGTPNPAIEGLHETTPIRDTLERTAARCAYQRNLPIRAICRGMQMIVALSGGKLICDIKLARKHNDIAAGDGSIDHSSTDYAAFTHTVTAVPGTRMEKIFGSKPFPVNSIHHQCARSINKDCLQVGLVSSDGIIEGVEGNNFLGLQWHPEYFADDNPNNIYSKFFFTFIEDATHYHSSYN